MAYQAEQNDDLAIERKRLMKGHPNNSLPDLYTLVMEIVEQPVS